MNFFKFIHSFIHEEHSSIRLLIENPLVFLIFYPGFPASQIHIQLTFSNVFL